VVGAVLRRCALLGAAGVVVGSGLAWLATPSIGSLIVGVEPSDPLTFLLVGAGLLVAVTLAGVAPARRAARIDPLNALRQE
jgi:ABC-type antimicrobial peptide transport system permease subunit